MTDSVGASLPGAAALLQRFIDWGSDMLTSAEYERIYGRDDSLDDLIILARAALEAGPSRAPPFDQVNAIAKLLKDRIPFVCAFEEIAQELFDVGVRVRGEAGPPLPEPSKDAIQAAWDANARCGMYAASKEGIAAALRAGYAVDFVIRGASLPPQE